MKSEEQRARELDEHLRAKATERTYALHRVAAEVERAQRLHGEGYHSDHEAYAVLLEEVEEVWEWVKKKRAERDRAAMVQELVQVAAVAVKWAEQLERGT